MVEGRAKSRFGGRASNIVPCLPVKGTITELARKAGKLKGVSSWVGVATLADIPRINRGVLAVRHSSNLLEVKLGGLRRHLHFLVLADLAYNALPQVDDAWPDICQLIEHVHLTHHVLFRIVFINTWPLSQASRKHPDMDGALFYFLEQG